MRSAGQARASVNRLGFNFRQNLELVHHHKLAPCRPPRLRDTNAPRNRTRCAITQSLGAGGRHDRRPQTSSHGSSRNKELQTFQQTSCHMRAFLGRSMGINKPLVDRGEPLLDKNPVKLEPGSETEESETKPNRSARREGRNHIIQNMHMTPPLLRPGGGGAFTIREQHDAGFPETQM